MLLPAGTLKLGLNLPPRPHAQLRIHFHLHESLEGGDGTSFPFSAPNHMPVPNQVTGYLRC